MFTKLVEVSFIVLLLTVCFFIGEAPSNAAYDPTSQSWGIVSLTGATGNVCTINRWKSGNGVQWVSCTYNSTTATYTLTFTSGFFPAVPICQLTPVGNPLMFYFTGDPTTGSASVVSVTLLNVVANGTFFLTCR